MNTSKLYKVYLCLYYRFEYNEVLQDREKLEKENRVYDEARKRMEKSCQTNTSHLEKARYATFHS